MKKFVVVAYDIEDDKKRAKVAKIMERHGQRVNKSVFECYLSETRLAKLKTSLNEHISRPDSVLYYFLCHSCIGKIERQGVVAPSQKIVNIF